MPADVMNYVPTLKLRIVSFKLRFVSCYRLFQCSPFLSVFITIISSNDVYLIFFD